MSVPTTTVSDVYVAPHQTLLRFVIVLAGTLGLYALLVWLCWLPDLLPHGRVTIGTITNRSVGGSALLALIGATLYALYIYGAILLWRDPPRASARIVWGGAIGAALLLLWTYPVTSTDVFDYVFRAHMAVHYDANPYLIVPNRFKSDAWFRYVGWPNAPSAYGPLWEMVSAWIVRLGGDSLLRNVLLYKAFAVATHIGTAACIRALIAEPRLRLLGTYLWLWSPLALWEFGAIGHNDGLIVLALLLALWAVQHKHHSLAVMALVGGALFKFLPAVFLPLVVIHWIRQQRTWARHARALVLALLLCVLPTIVLYAPYWDLPPNFANLNLSDQITAIWAGRTTTLKNISVREGFLNASPLAVVSYVLRTPTSLYWINTTLQSIGLPHTTDVAVRWIVSTVGTGLLGLGLIFQSWQIWFRHRTLWAAFLGLLLWYVLASSQWFQPWYLLWLLALIAVRPDRSSMASLTVWSTTAQASYLLQFIVLPNLKLSGQTLQAQVYYLLLIYPLPLIVWLWLRWRRSIRQRPRDPRPVPLPTR